MNDKIDTAITIGEPYLFIRDGIVGLTITQYFKLEGLTQKTITTPLEGVLGMDLHQNLFESEMSKLAIEYEHFFLASA